MNGNENNKLTEFLEKTRHKELEKHTLKDTVILHTLVYMKLLIKESSFFQTFNYKLPLRKEFLGEGGGHFFNSSLPPVSQTLRH